jgi:hypothetical protein
MFRIVWDKEDIERGIKSGTGEAGPLGFLTPIQVYANGVDISGLEEVPKGNITHFDGLFLEFFYIFHSIDPENLQEKQFHMSSNVKNRVYGGGFDIYVYHDKESDILTLKYHNFMHPEYRTLDIPLKDFTEGILQSATEMLEEVLRVAPEFEDDINYTVLKEDMKLIRSWYQERYGTATTSGTSVERSTTAAEEERIRWIGVEDAADPELIDCVQKILDIKYPDDYLACVKNYSLGFPYPYNIIVNERIIGGRSQFVQLRGFDPEKPMSYVLTLYYALNCPASGIDAYLPDNVVPFADALGDDRLCFDYREGFPPKVVYWIPHEPDPDKSVIFLCNSFTELLEIVEKSE